MKKFLLTLGLCLMLPFSAMLTGCGHEHTYEEGWTTNTTHHWHKATCEHADQKSGYKEHRYDNALDSVCNDCGVARIDYWDGTVGNVPTEVQGVIMVTSGKELAAIADAVNRGHSFDNVTVKLMRDIDLQDNQWTPIGKGGSDYRGIPSATAAVFKGIFDGQNHTIKNLKATTFVGGAASEGAATGVGLFGAVAHATIKDVTLENVTVSGNHNVAAVVGHARGTTIQNVNVVNASVSCVYLDDEESGDKAGVIAGYFGNMTAVDSMLENCSATDATVNAARDAGQLIGCLAMDITAPQTTSSQRNNTATNVEVVDNNLIQDVSINDNIKNDVVGRIHNARLDYWEGTVTTIPAEDAYGVIKISNGRQLAAIAQAVNAGNTFAGKTIKLEKDIDLQNHEWTPIGYGTSDGLGGLETGNRFEGTFDGQNHTIKNLMITTFKGGLNENASAARGVGLFGQTHNAVIKNLNIENAQVVGNHYVAALAGFTLGTEISGCNVKNAIITNNYLCENAEGDKAAAVVAYVANTQTYNAKVENCGAQNCSISAVRDAGWVIGTLKTHNYGSSTQATQTNNTAADVYVDVNNSAPETYNRTGEHITNDIVSTK